MKGDEMDYPCSEDFRAWGMGEFKTEINRGKAYARDLLSDEEYFNLPFVQKVLKEMYWGEK